jgi:hypothetical protein
MSGHDSTIASKRIVLACLFAGLFSLSLAVVPARGAQPAKALDLSTDSTTAWVADRLTGDDFLPPSSGPGPVMSDPMHPYVPNGVGRQPTYRVADLTNPILMPWAVEQMKKANDAVLAGKVPYIARERCWPSGVPGYLVDTRIVPLYFLQTEKEIVTLIQTDARMRHIYLNVPHSEYVMPSWYGESVGHYEGDTLVVDTIGMNDKTFVDNYRTPHTTQIHTVERYQLLDNGNTLQIVVTVDDPGAFTVPWSAIQRYKRVRRAPIAEERCAENNSNYLNEEIRPIPQASKPDF